MVPTQQERNKTVTNYIVICRTDDKADGYVLVTRQIFKTREDAKHYADAVSPTREPLIVEGAFGQMRPQDPPVVKRKPSPTSAAEIAKGPFGLGPKPETTRKRWMGTPPATCDVCNAPTNGVFIDGRMRGGSWANMCETCHKSHGAGLGTGKGQKYEKGDQGFWWKTAGMLALCFGLSACGGPAWEWRDATGTRRAGESDLAACRFEMVRAVPNTYSTREDPIASGITTGLARVEVFSACMEMKGNRKVRV